MDFSKFKTSTWLMVGGAIAMVIGGNFLDWVKVDFGDLGEDSIGGSSSGASAFDFGRGKVSWFLVVAVGVVALVTVLGKMPKTKLPVNMLSLVAGAVASILMITRIISDPVKGGGDYVKWTLGAYVATAAAIAATVGAFMEFSASGGNIKDLTDANKWKGEGGATA